MQIRKNMIIHGRVQGVGFRYLAFQTAKAMGLCGSVENLYNGDVELEIQGEDFVIEEYVKRLGQERYVRIDSIDSRNVACIDDDRFLVK